MDLKRIYFRKKLTSNLGRVIETEDKIICYVRKSKCKKEKKGEKYKYTIHCNGVSGKNTKLAKKYNLDKPICYIIDNKKIIDGEIYIFGKYNSEIIIKDCEIEDDLYILTDGKCTLENTTIETNNKLSLIANELVLKNMNLMNYFKGIKRNLKFNISAYKKIDIIDSKIGDVLVKVFLESDKDINLVNSNIFGEGILISANKIVTDRNSNIEAENVELDVEDYNLVNIRTIELVHKKMNLTRMTSHVNVDKQEGLSKIKKDELKESFSMINDNNYVQEDPNEDKPKPKVKILKK